MSARAREWCRELSRRVQAAAACGHARRGRTRQPGRPAPRLRLNVDPWIRCSAEEPVQGGSGGTNLKPWPHRRSRARVVEWLHITPRVRQRVATLVCIREHGRYERQAVHGTSCYRWHRLVILRLGDSGVCAVPARSSAGIATPGASQNLNATGLPLDLEVCPAAPCSDASEACSNSRASANCGRRQRRKLVHHAQV